MSVGNVYKSYRLADAVDLQEGRLAYLRYNEIMRRIAFYYGYPLKSVTAAFCALSPKNDYVGNLRSLISCLKGHKEGVDPARIVISTYTHCKLRALDYIGGVDFLAKTKGPKTTAFYLNILHPRDPGPVTIDGHMVGVWYDKRLTMQQAVEMRFNYGLIADGFREVARAEGLITNQLQGILWFTQKRRYRVLYNGTYNLLNAGDHWQLIRRPEEIRPYKFLTQVKTEARAARGLPEPQLSFLEGMI